MLIYAGDSWAWKGYTDQNFDKQFALPSDKRMADFWGIPYITAFTTPPSNLRVLDKVKLLDNKDPVIWIFTEPCRDYNRITGRPEFEWMWHKDFFKIRKELRMRTLEEIKSTIQNPVALIGGLSDIDTEFAESLGFKVLHSSWQKWIAQKVNNNTSFEFGIDTQGWGASDIGWRMHEHPDLKPSSQVVFACHRLIQEWCHWETHGYFNHDHPTPKANQEFAEFLRDDVVRWYHHVHQ